MAEYSRIIELWKGQQQHTTTTLSVQTHQCRRHTAFRSFVTFVRKKNICPILQQNALVRMTYFMGPGRSNDKYAQLTLASKRIFYYCLFLLRIRVLFLPVFPFERSEREAKGPYIQILSKNCIFLSN